MADDLDRAFAELRLLNLPVPKPPSLPSEADVDRVLDDVGVVVHNDLRRWFLEASDIVFGSLEPVRVGGGHTDFAKTLDLARSWGVPPDAVPICEDNSDFYCIEPSGEVVYWSHNGTTDERWPDLATWITEVWIGGN